MHLLFDLLGFKGIKISCVNIFSFFLRWNRIFILPPNICLRKSNKSNVQSRQTKFVYLIKPYSSWQLHNQLGSVSHLSIQLLFFFQFFYFPVVLMSEEAELSCCLLEKAMIQSHRRLPESVNVGYLNFKRTKGAREKRTSLTLSAWKKRQKKIYK